MSDNGSVKEGTPKLKESSDKKRGRPSKTVIEERKRKKREEEILKISKQKEIDLKRGSNKFKSGAESAEQSYIKKSVMGGNSMEAKKDNKVIEKVDEKNELKGIDKVISDKIETLSGMVNQN